MGRNAFWLFVFAFLILIVFLPSYTRWQDLRQKNSDYAKQIRQLKEENARLYEEKNRLEYDPVYLEKVARERMGLVRDGEVVYKITPINKEETQNKDLRRTTR